MKINTQTNMVTEYTDIFQIYELKEESSDSCVRICPERGGIVIGFRSRGKELFYLDEATFFNARSNIRGGNPVLFPICGQLINAQYDLEGKTYDMKNHGLARTMTWEAEDFGLLDEEFPFLKISIKSNDETRTSYPFDFKVTFEYILKNGDLIINQEYENTGTSAQGSMPFHAGFHPYFAVSTKMLHYITSAPKCYDYNDMREKYFSSPFDISGLTDAVLLEDDGSRRIGFYEDNPEDGILLEYGPEFKYIMLWSVDGKPFVCVEPWMARTGEFHKKDELLWLEPGGKLSTWLKIKRENF